VQTNFFGDNVLIGDTEAKILACYGQDPKVADSDRLLILAVWELEGLAEVLGDRLEAFADWFKDSATSTETITRAGRKLRSQGLMKQSPEIAQARRQLAEAHRQYWGHKG
jgi:ABC-type transporter Mla subunit MlaD